MVVWTSDRRQFFFDVTSRVSLWIMPEELKDNPLVEKIIDDGPDGEGEGHLHMGTSRIEKCGRGMCDPNFPLPT